MVALWTYYLTGRHSLSHSSKQRSNSVTGSTKLVGHARTQFLPVIGTKHLPGCQATTPTYQPSGKKHVAAHGSAIAFEPPNGAYQNCFERGFFWSQDCRQPSFPSHLIQKVVLPPGDNVRILLIYTVALINIHTLHKLSVTH